MAGWGDDPELEELRRLIYDEGWEPVRVSMSPGGAMPDQIVVGKDGETREFASDHIAFHRFAEGLREDHPTLPG